MTRTSTWRAVRKAAVAPAKWAFRARTIRGKVFKGFLVFSLYTSPLRMLPRTPSTYQTNNPSQSTSAQVFEQELKANLIGNQFDSEKSYAREILEAWENQARQLYTESKVYEAALSNACSDLKEWHENVDEIAQAAQRENEKNGVSRPLEQYRFWYQVKFKAAKKAGC